MTTQQRPVSSEEHRSRLVLLHYSVVAGVPLLITLILFIYFAGNSAEFTQQPLGIKFGGPLAAYAGLVVMMQILLNRTFKTLREEDLHRQQLAVTDISPQDAFERSESFARLAADFCIMEMISMRMDGFSEDDVTQVVSVVRKNAYRLPKVVGSFTLQRGSYVLADLLTAAINNGEFIDEFKQFVTTLFANQKPVATAPHPLSDNPNFQFAQAYHGHLVPVDQPRLPVAPATIFASVDVELARKKLSNIIWRHCELAIKHPDISLANAFLKP